MRNRSLVSLLVVTILLSAFAMVAAAQDGGMQMQLLLPMPNNPIATSAFPVAVQFVNPVDGQVNHYEATIDGRRFIKGDVNLSKVQPGQSYSFRIDGDLSVYSPLLEPGLHVFNIRLLDSRGRSIERQVNFYLQTAIVPKTIAPPTVRIISPVNGEEIKGPVNIKVEALGTTGIKYITVFINNVPYGITSEYPYTVSWDPIKAKMTPGNYSISASAIDLSDNHAVSPTVVVKLADQGNFTNFNAMYPLTRAAMLNDYLGIAHPAISSMVNDMPFAYKADFGIPMVAYALSARTGVQTPGALRDLIALIPISNSPSTNLIANSSPLQAYGLTTPMALAYKANSIAPMSISPIFMPMRNPIVIPALLTGDANPAFPAISSPADTTPGMKTGRAYPVMNSMPIETGNSVTAGQATSPVPNGIGSTMVILPATNVQPVGTKPATLANLQDNAIPAHNSITSDTPKYTTIVNLPVAKPANEMPEVSTIINAGAVRTQNIKPSDPTAQAQLSSTKTGTVNSTSGYLGYLIPASPDTAIVNKTIPAGNPKHNTTVTLPAVSPVDAPAIQGSVAVTPAQTRCINPAVLSTPQLIASAKIGTANSQSNYAMPSGPQIQAISSGAISAPDVKLATGTRLQTSNGESYTIKGILVADQTRGISPTQFSRIEAPEYFRSSWNFTRPSSIPLASIPAIGGVANTGVELARISGKSSYFSRAYQVNDSNPSYFTTIASVPKYSDPNVGSNNTITVQSSYIIRVGDTLNSIAAAYHATPVELQQMNPGIDFIPEKEIIVPVANARIYVDSKPVIACGAYYPSPYVVNGTAMVPMRMLVEAKGGVVVWLEKDMTVNAWSNGSFVDVKIDSKAATVNNDTINLSRAAHIVADRTMVPMSFLAETLNMEASYNTTSGTYALISKK
ncbi:MAG: stalk domain-containing protein [bacterium]